MHILVHIFIANLLCCAIYSKALTKNQEEDGEIYAYHNKRAGNRTAKELNDEIDAEFWRKNAIQAITERIQRKINRNIAKNVILFLGDGMSIPTITATRVYLGGEEKQLSFEKFPYTGLSKTYCVDHQVADSACSATAYLCGTKANLGTIGVTAAVLKNNCTLMNNLDNRVYSIARQFQLKGKQSGLVTTTRVTHASPAAVYAHTASRHWECDTDIIKHGEEPHQCEDIAHQLVFGETGQNLNVVFGGGRKKFLPKEIVDEENQSGERSDHISLIEEWKKQKEMHGHTAKYIWNREQLLNLDHNNTDFVLGLFESGHTKYNVDRDPYLDPSLEEMTMAAIKQLRKSPNGYFLFVEGGRIDTAHHDATAQKALDETAEFSKAVQRAVEMTSEEDTLIVVTADHAHTMSFSGYAERGSDIFGYAGQGSDQKLYTILNYANGPGYKPIKDGERFVPSEEDAHDIDFQYQSVVPMISETHGGDDVAVFAKGPYSHLFTGVMEENVIPHLMSFAACVSSDLNCDDNRKLS